MDRNTQRRDFKALGLSVALRKESVDRNSTYVTRLPRVQVSLSARRAWIEILTLTVRNVLIESLSARRAWIEIRKRNTPSQNQKVSLSARRAWIEMIFWPFRPCWKLVALRKESVDRNCVKLLLQLMMVLSLSARRAWIEICCPCRSPWLLASLSARRAWIEIKMLLRDSNGRSGRSPQGERG